MKFTKKPVTIEAITFDELVAYGLDFPGVNIVGGMPWSFNYCGHPITHENDDCYLIPTLEGMHRMTRDDMLITGIKGEIYPCKKDIFEATYVHASGPVTDIAGEVREDKQLRVDLDAIIQRVKGCPGSRERSLVITKLQEAVMWLGMDLKRLGEANPYPNSRNPESPVIDPTAQGMKL